MSMHFSALGHIINSVSVLSSEHRLGVRGPRAVVLSYGERGEVSPICQMTSIKTHLKCGHGLVFTDLVAEVFEGGHHLCIFYRAFRRTLLIARSHFFCRQVSLIPATHQTSQVSAIFVSSFPSAFA